MFQAVNGVVGAGQRHEVSGYCTEPFCAGADDVAYAGADALLLASLACGNLFTFEVPGGTQISGGSYGVDACLPLNPQNSVLYSSLTKWAYLVTRHYSLGITGGLAAVDPATFASFFISGFNKVPEAAAFAPNNRLLYIVGQDTFKSPLVLDQFDAVTGEFVPHIYGFSTLTKGRTAIDAEIVQAPGVFTVLASGLPFVGGKSLGTSFGQLALVMFGLVLLRLDRKRRA
jgi:hypothetical protein